MIKADNKGCRLNINWEKADWSYWTKGNFGIKEASFSLEINGFKANFSEEERIKISHQELEIKDCIGFKKRILIKSILARFSLEWEIYFDIYKNNSFIILGCSFKNLSPESINLGKCILLEVDKGKEGRLIFGDSFQNATFFSESGWQLKTFVKSLESDEGKHISQTIGHLYNPELPLALNTSFVTFNRAKTEIKLDYERNKGIQKLQAYCNFDGYALGPDKKIESEKLFIDLRKNPFSSLEEWADVVNKIYKPQIWKQLPVGWWGWAGIDCFKEKSYEEIVLENVSAIEEKLNGFGLQYAFIVVGNLWRDMPGYWLKENKKRFPLGLKWLVKKLSKYNLKIGLWVAPFWVPERPTELFEKMKNCFLKKDGDFLYDNNGWSYGEWADLPKEKRPGFYILDPSHPGTLKWLREIFTEYRKIGIRYYMIDYWADASGSTPGRYIYDDYYDKNLIKGPEVIRKGLQVIRENVGKDTYLLSSTSPTLQGVGIFDGVRVGRDYGEGRPKGWSKSYSDKIYVTENWELHREVCTNAASSYFTHKKLYINDSINALAVGESIPLNEAQISVTLFGICGGPMMLSDNIASISKERLSLIKKCLPRYDEVAHPVDLFTSIYPNDYPKIFNLQINRDWGSWTVLAVFNFEEKEKKIGLKIKELGLQRKRFYFLYEFWTEKLEGLVKNEFEIRVPAYSVKLFSIQEKRDYPWIISTDMHITQGGVEIEEVNWQPENKTLMGKCQRPKGEKGNLILHIPDNFKIRETINCKLWQKEKMILGIKKIELDFKKSYVDWKIRFVNSL